MNKALKFTLWYSFTYLYLFVLLLAFMYIKFDIQDLWAFIYQFKSKIFLGLNAPALTTAMGVTSATNGKPRNYLLKRWI